MYLLTLALIFTSAARADTCGIGYLSCIVGGDPVCYSASNGDSCCGNGIMCFTGFYCDPKGCCPIGVSSADCVPGPLISVASSASVLRPTGSSSTTGSKGAGTKNVNNEALGLVLGGLGVLLTL